MDSEKPNIKVFSDVLSLNLEAASYIVKLAKDAVHKRGRFIIVLAGGETPNAIYAILSKPPFRNEMPWHNTFVFWGDERCVPLEDKSNNANAAITIMLNHVPIPFSNIFRIPVNLVPAEAAKCYEKTITEFFMGKPVFDLILLGLGENGHTASLFPDTPVLRESAPGVRTVFDADGGMMRISMTAPMLNLARKILFIVQGQNKATILQKVIKGPFLPDSYPAQLINSLKGSTSWFVDLKAMV